MKDFTVSKAIAAASAAATAGAAIEAERIAQTYFGLPLAALGAAFAGAVVMVCMTDSMTFKQLARHAVGSMLLSLLLTAGVMRFFELHAGYSIAVAGLLAMFARDIYTGGKGVAGQFVSDIRARFFGAAKE